MAKSLKAQIEELSKPVNPDFDIENDVFENGVNDSGSEGSGSDDDEERGKQPKYQDTEHYIPVARSKLRQVEDDEERARKLGVKYAGEVTSRSELFGSGVNEDISEDESENEEDEEEDEEDGETESDEGEVSFDDSEDDLEEEEEEAEEEQDQEESEEISYKREKLKQLMDNERKHIINRLSSASKTDALKGFAVSQQQKVFDQIIDTRIKLQKAVTASNQLPLTKEKYNEVVDKKNRSSGSSKIVVKKLGALLDQVFELRQELFIKDKIVKDLPTTTLDETNKKKRKFDQFLETTESLDEVTNKYRDGVLLKWSQKINSASGTQALNSNKFKTINQDSLTQVQNNLADFDKLIKRTQLNRKNLKPMGGLILDMEQNDRTLQYSSYIFDDEDFYRVVLNDLIDKKLSSNEQISSNLTIAKTAPSTKLHKNYERKASKGRKLNYQIQEPLANFETPNLALKKWNDDQIDEFFASLLGQKVNMNERSDDENENDDNDDVIQDTGLKIFG